MSQVYRVASSEIYCEQFGNDLVVLNLGSGQYFGFNASASLIWKALIEHQASLEDLCAAGFSQDTLNTCIARLEELGLIRPGIHPARPFPAELHLEAALAEPEVELYDDLASLILADPIHDVVEAGWPKIASNT
jgi:hypothetical protein